MSKSSPLDFFKPSTKYADHDTVEARMAVCESCDHLLKPMKMCDICHCVMPLKTRLAHAECPDGKWQAVVGTE